MLKTLFMVGLFLFTPIISADENSDAITEDMQQTADQEAAKANGTPIPQREEFTEGSAKSRVERGLNIDLESMNGSQHLRTIELSKDKDPYSSGELSNLGNQYLSILSKLEDKYKKDIPYYDGDDRANYFTSLYALSRQTADKLEIAKQELVSRKREMCILLRDLRAKSVGNGIGNDEKATVSMDSISKLFKMFVYGGSSEVGSLCNMQGANMPTVASYSYFNPNSSDTNTPSGNNNIVSNDGPKGAIRNRGKGAIANRGSEKKESKKVATKTSRAAVQIPYRQNIFVADQSPVNCFKGSKKQHIVDVNCNCIQTGTCLKPTTPRTLPTGHRLQGTIVEKSLIAFHKAEGLLFHGNPHAASKQLLILEKNSGKVAAIRNKLQNDINQNRVEDGLAPLNFAARVKRTIANIQNAAVLALKKVSPQVAKKFDKYLRSGFINTKANTVSKGLKNQSAFEYADKLLKKNGYVTKTKAAPTIDEYNLGASDTSQFEIKKKVKKVQKRTYAQARITGSSESEEIFSKYKYNQEDIIQKDNLSIFNIISNRYRMKNMELKNND